MLFDESFLFFAVVVHTIEIILFYNVVQGCLYRDRVRSFDLVSVVCNKQTRITTGTSYTTCNIFTQWSITVSLKWEEKKIQNIIYNFKNISGDWLFNATGQFIWEMVWSSCQSLDGLNSVE